MTSATLRQSFFDFRKDPTKLRDILKNTHRKSIKINKSKERFLKQQREQKTQIPRAILSVEKKRKRSRPALRSEDDSGSNSESQKTEHLHKRARPNPEATMKNNDLRYELTPSEEIQLDRKKANFEKIKQILIARDQKAQSSISQSMETNHHFVSIVNMILKVYIKREFIPTSYYSNGQPKNTTRKVVEDTFQALQRSRFPPKVLKSYRKVFSPEIQQKYHDRKREIIDNLRGPFSEMMECFSKYESYATVNAIFSSDPDIEAARKQDVDTILKNSNIPADSNVDDDGNQTPSLYARRKEALLASLAKVTELETLENTWFMKAMDSREEFSRMVNLEIGVDKEAELCVATIDDINANREDLISILNAAPWLRPLTRDNDGDDTMSNINTFTKVDFEKYTHSLYAPFFRPKDVGRSASGDEFETVDLFKQKLDFFRHFENMDASDPIIRSSRRFHCLNQEQLDILDSVCDSPNGIMESDDKDITSVERNVNNVLTQHHRALEMEMKVLKASYEVVEFCLLQQLQELGLNIIYKYKPRGPSEKEIKLFCFELAFLPHIGETILRNKNDACPIQGRNKPDSKSADGSRSWWWPIDIVEGSTEFFKEKLGFVAALPGALRKHFLKTPNGDNNDSVSRSPSQLNNDSYQTSSNEPVAAHICEEMESLLPNLKEYFPNKETKWLDEVEAEDIIESQKDNLTKANESIVKFMHERSLSVSEENATSPNKYNLRASTMTKREAYDELTKQRQLQLDQPTKFKYLDQRHPLYLEGTAMKGTSDENTDKYQDLIRDGLPLVNMLVELKLQENPSPESLKPAHRISKTTTATRAKNTTKTTSNVTIVDDDEDDDDWREKVKEFTLVGPRNKPSISDENANSNGVWAKLPEKIIETQKELMEELNEMLTEIANEKVEQEKKKAVLFKTPEEVKKFIEALEKKDFSKFDPNRRTLALHLEENKTKPNSDIVIKSIYQLATIKQDHTFRASFFGGLKEYWSKQGSKFVKLAVCVFIAALVTYGLSLIKSDASISSLNIGGGGGNNNNNNDIQEVMVVKRNDGETAHIMSVKEPNVDVSGYIQAFEKQCPKTQNCFMNTDDRMVVANSAALVGQTYFNNAKIKFEECLGSSSTAISDGITHQTPNNNPAILVGINQFIPVPDGPTLPNVQALDTFGNALQNASTEADKMISVVRNAGLSPADTRDLCGAFENSKNVFQQTNDMLKNNELKPSNANEIYNSMMKPVPDAFKRSALENVRNQNNLLKSHIAHQKVLEQEAKRVDAAIPNIFAKGKDGQGNMFIKRCPMTDDRCKIVEKLQVNVMRKTGFNLGLNRLFSLEKNYINDFCAWKARHRAFGQDAMTDCLIGFLLQACMVVCMSYLVTTSHFTIARVLAWKMIRSFSVQFSLLMGRVICGVYYNSYFQNRESSDREEIKINERLDFDTIQKLLSKTSEEDYAKTRRIILEDFRISEMASSVHFCLAVPDMVESFLSLIALLYSWFGTFEVLVAIVATGTITLSAIYAMTTKWGKRFRGFLLTCSFISGITCAASVGIIYLKAKMSNVTWVNSAVEIKNESWWIPDDIHKLWYYPKETWEQTKNYTSGLLKGYTSDKPGWEMVENPFPIVSPENEFSNVPDPVIGGVMMVTSLALQAWMTSWTKPMTDDEYKNSMEREKEIRKAKGSIISEYAERLNRCTEGVLPKDGVSKWVGIPSSLSYITMTFDYFNPNPIILENVRDLVYDSSSKTGVTTGGCFIFLFAFLIVFHLSHRFGELYSNMATNAKYAIMSKEQRADFAKAERQRENNEAQVAKCASALAVKKEMIKEKQKHELKILLLKNNFQKDALAAKLTNNDKEAETKLKNARDLEAGREASRKERDQNKYELEQWKLRFLEVKYEADNEAKKEAVLAKMAQFEATLAARQQQQKDKKDTDDKKAEARIIATKISNLIKYLNILKLHPDSFQRTREVMDKMSHLKELMQEASGDNNNTNTSLMPALTRDAMKAYLEQTISVELNENGDDSDLIAERLWAKGMDDQITALTASIEGMRTNDETLKTLDEIEIDTSAANQNDGDNDDGDDNMDEYEAYVTSNSG